MPYRFAYVWEVRSWIYINFSTCGTKVRCNVLLLFHLVYHFYQLCTLPRPFSTNLGRCGWRLKEGHRKWEISAAANKDVVELSAEGLSWYLSQKDQKYKRPLIRGKWHLPKVNQQISLQWSLYTFLNSQKGRILLFCHIHKIKIIALNGKS